MLGPSAREIARAFRPGTRVADAVYQNDCDEMWHQGRISQKVEREKKFRKISNVCMMEDNPQQEACMLSVEMCGSIVSIKLSDNLLDE